MSLRFDSSWGLRIFSLSHARDKTKKNIFRHLVHYFEYVSKVAKDTSAGSWNSFIFRGRRIGEYDKKNPHYRDVNQQETTNLRT